LPIDTGIDEIIENFEPMYRESVWQFTSLVCEICDKKIYPTLSRTIPVSEPLKNAFLSINKEYVVKDSCRTCSRCYEALKSNRIPSLALCNQMSLAPVPKQIEDLTEAELGLIKQVKAFMKLYLLCKGRGQKAMKGMTIHFAQQVQEVASVLPLPQSQSDILIVNEEDNFLGVCKEVKIRPQKMLEALAWLVKNNPFYKNIEINYNYQAESHQTITLNNPHSITNRPDYNSQRAISYVLISENQFVLRASFHQGNPIFKSNAGKQCTAMCASFLAHAAVDSPVSWTQLILDKVLIYGDSYYTSLRNTNDYLNVDEVVGSLQAFDCYKVSI